VSGGLWRWLRAVLAQRKWIVWVALAIALAAALEIGVALGPPGVRHALVQYEEQSNGVRQSAPTGVREAPRGR
jgi:hypothetical protein